ncbi:MAG: inositol monophosphatase family protein [Pseudomonadales bacterium]
MAQHPTVNIALCAARKAGDLIMREVDRLDLLQVEEKGLNDFVSEMDKKAEQEIIYHINKAFPEHAILAEESGSSGAQQDAEFEWVIDPIDGTTNYVRGIPHFAVSIACKQHGRLEHAVVYDPVRQEEFTASRGRGAQLNGRRIRVSKRIELTSAVIGTGIPFLSRQHEHLPAYMETLEQVSANSAGIRRAGAASLDLAYVAAGRLDAFWELGLNEWDIAAGALLILEAGGLVSDFNGGQDYLSSGNIVCGNPKCFKALLQVVQPKLAKI